MLALALLAVPLWYGFNSNLGTFRAYVPGAEMQRFVDLFHRDGPQAVAAAMDAYAKSLPADQVAIFAGPQKQRLAGNLPRWPAEVPDEPGTYGLTIDPGDGSSTRVVTSQVALPGGYRLLMGRESVRFESLVARFWYGVIEAVAIVLALALLFAWLLRRSQTQLEALVAQRTAQLRSSEERYARAMEATAVGHWEWDLVTHQVFHSPRFRELYGIALDERFADRDAWKARQPLSPSERARQEQALQAAIADPAKNYDIELSFEVGPRELRWLRSRGKVFRAEDGTPLRISGATSDITAQKLAQDALRESEKRYERVMLAAEAGFWDWDVRADEFYVSPKLLEMTDFAPGTKFAGRADFMARAPFHPDDRTKWEHAVKELFASGGTRLAMEIRSIHGGETRWALLSGMCVRDTAGKILRWTGSATDISARKRAEVALRQSDDRYARVMQASEDGFWEWVVATDEFYASPRMLALYGLPPGTVFRGRADFLSRCPFHPEDLESWRKAVAAHLAGQSARVDLEVRAKVQSKTRWLHLTAICQRGASGAEERWTGSVSDVTERRRAQQALRVSEERYARAMEGSDAGHWDWNIVSDEMFVSERAREMLALPAGALPAHRSEIMALVPMHPDDRAAMIEAVTAGIRSGIHERDYRIIPRPGEVRWLRTRARVYKDARGAALRMTGSLIDITERKLAAERLRASEERYSLAMEASDEGHFDYDVETGELFISERMNEIYGFAPGTRFEKRDAYLQRFSFYGNDADTYHAAVRAAEAQGGPERYEFEYRILRPSGELRWLRTRGKVTRDAEGRALRRTGVVADITKAKLAEQALLQSQERYALAMEAAADGHMDWNLVTGEHYLSPQMLRMVGHPPDATFADRAEWVRRFPFHPEDRKRWEAAMAAHFAGREAKFRENFRIVVNGETRWLAFNFIATRDPAGKPVRWTGSIADIHDAKLAEEGLRESQERYALAVAGSDAGVWDYDFVARRHFSSARARELGGLPPEPQALAMTEEGFAVLPLHPEDVPRRIAAMQAHLAGKTPMYEGEFRVRQPDGAYRWRRIQGLCVRDANGKPLRLAGSISDIDARKRAEEGLRLSEQRYALALEASEEGHFDSDLEKGEMFVSARLNEIYGFPRQAQVANRLEYLERMPLHPADRHLLADVIRPDLEDDGRDVYEFECRIVPRPGEIRWIHTRGKTVRDAAGRARRRVGVVADITDRKRAEEGLRRSEAALRLSEERYALALEASEEGHFDTDLDTDQTFVSARLSEIYGFARQPRIEDWGEWLGKIPFHPDDHRILADLVRPAWEDSELLRGDLYEFEYRIVVRGETRWVHTRGMVTRDAEGRPRRRIGVVADITARKVAEALLSGEKRILEKVAKGEPLQEVLDELCRLVEELAPGVLASILLLDGNVLRHGGAPSLPKAYTDLIDGAAIGPSAGSCGTAAYRGQQVIVSDIATDALWADYRAAALPHGLRACWSTPVLSPEGKVIATFAMYYREPRSPAARDQQIIEQIGHLAGVAIQHKLAAQRLGQSEKELRLSEERYALAVAGSNDGIWDWDILTGRMFVSERAQRIFGLEPGQTERPREEWHAMIEFHPDDHQTQRRMVEEYLAGARSGNEGDWRVRAKDGGYRWIRIRSICLRNAAGEPVRMAGSVSDIDAQKKAEGALRLSEERYALAMEAAQDAHWDFKIGTDEYYTSPRVAEVFGLPPGTVFTSRVDYLAKTPLVKDDLDAWLSASRELFESTGSRLSMDLRAIIGGEVRWIQHNGVCFRDASGRAVRWCGTVRDVTDRRRAQVALALSEERYALAMEASEEGHFDWNVRSDEIFASAHLKKLLDMPAGLELRTRGDMVANMPFYPGDREQVAQMAREVLAGGAREHEFEYRLVRDSSAEPRWIRARWNIFRDAQGAAERVIGVVSDITERKRVEEDLRESEARFRALTELSSDWYWEQDENLRFTYLSDQAGQLTGYSGESSLGKTRWEIANMTPLTCSWEEHQAVLRARAPFRDLECRRVGPDGVARYLSMSGAPIFDAQGEFRGYRGTGRNITARKRIEEELLRSQHYLAEAQSLSHIGSWALNAAGFQYWSAELFKIHGLDPGGKAPSIPEYLALVHPEDRDSVVQEIQKILAGGVGLDFKKRIVRPDGEIRIVRCVGIPASTGGSVEFVGSGMDVTEQERAEEALRKSEERFSLAVAGSNEGIFDWDLPSDRVYVSYRAQELFGLPRGELWRPRRDWRHILTFHSDDAPRLHDAIKAHIEGNSPTYDVEFRIVVPDGTVRWFRQRGIALRDASGKAYRVVGSIGDVTEKHIVEEELKGMERKLRLAQRLEAMGTLAGGIAHDFNNILGAILGYGEMALRDVAKGSRLRRDLDSILVAGERGRALVDRVLAFSRSGVGERVPVHVEKVVREALDLVSAKLPPDVTLHAKLHAARAAMQGDATQVHQLLMNLATNAVQAMPQGGTLRVSLETVLMDAAHVPTIGTVNAGEYVVLKVADTGTGIPPEIMDRIFDPFFTTKEVGTGTGLGLSLVHGIVAEVGGAIDVASKVGAGTTFTVYLPRSGDAKDSSQIEDLQLPRGDGQRVMIVDDEEPLVQLATRTLEELGYAPVGFTSSTKALAAFRADPQRFDAVLTDERMPGMSGSALIREVRGIRDRIPIVLMSGFVGGPVASRAREAGAEEVLKKPLSARDLAASLARVLHP